MNVNNARPLLAFWLLALAATLIALLGMRSGAASEVRTDTPAQNSAQNSAQPAAQAASVLG